jgi:(2Fe-2S) ferredoxin
LGNSLIRRSSAAGTKRWGIQRGEAQLSPLVARANSLRAERNQIGNKNAPQLCSGDFYQTHIFFCTYSRQGEKPCCAAKGAAETREYAKARVKALNLSAKGQVRVNVAGCLGRCNEGPTIVIYPEGVWYTYRSTEDIDEILQEHVIQGRIVTRLLMPSASFESNFPKDPEVKGDL